MDLEYQVSNTTVAATWADVFELPKAIVAGTDAEALPAVRDFVGRISSGDFSEWTLFHPTYLRFDLGPDGVARTAELCDYVSGGSV